MLRHQGDGKITGIMDSDKFIEYDENFIFRSRDIDGVYLEKSEKNENRTSTVFFKGQMCAIPDNEGKLYKFLREILINKSHPDRTGFHNSPEIKP